MSHVHDREHNGEKMQPKRLLTKPSHLSVTTDRTKKGVLGVPDQGGDIIGYEDLLDASVTELLIIFDHYF